MELSWSDLCKLIGGKVDAVENVSVGDFGSVVITVNGESAGLVKTQLERVVNGDYFRSAPVLEKRDYKGVWIDEINRVYHAPSQKIPAIKRIRELSGCGLVEAKAWVEHWFDSNGTFVPEIPSPF